MGHTVTWCRSHFSLSTNPSEGVGWARNDPKWCGRFSLAKSWPAWSVLETFGCFGCWDPFLENGGVDLRSRNRDLRGPFKSWPVGIFQQPLPPSNNPSDGMEPYKRLSTTPSDGFAPSKLLQTTLPRVWGLTGVFQQPLPKGMRHTVTWCRSRFSLSTNPSEGVGWARNDPQWYFNRPFGAFGWPWGRNNPKRYLNLPFGASGRHWVRNDPK